MTSSIDRKTHLIAFCCLHIIKTYSQLGIEEYFLNLIKVIYKNTTAHII